MRFRIAVIIFNRSSTPVSWLISFLAVAWKTSTWEDCADLALDDALACGSNSLRSVASSFEELLAKPPSALSPWLDEVPLPFDVASILVSRAPAPDREAVSEFDDELDIEKRGEIWGELYILD